MNKEIKTSAKAVAAVCDRRRFSTFSHSIGAHRAPLQTGGQP